MATSMRYLERKLSLLTSRERNKQTGRAYKKALSNLLPREQADVHEAINAMKGIHKCGDKIAIEIIAALGMFLDENRSD